MVNQNNSISPQETLAQADSVLPRFDWDDDRKRGYLSYRLCGFSRAEAISLVGIDRKTVRNWGARDTEFEVIEKTNLLELQQAFSKEVITLDFTRNFKLALDYDHSILLKAKVSETPEGMANGVFLTKEERGYLAKIRPLYTPQQFVALQDLFKDVGTDTGWDELLVIARKRNGTQNQRSNDSENSGLTEYEESAVVESG